MTFEINAVSFDIMGYLIGCLLLFAGAVVGWWASRRYEGRTRRDREPKASLEVDGAATTIKHAAASEADGAIQAQSIIPREWDGGPLRPDLNRQVALAQGLR